MFKHIGLTAAGLAAVLIAGSAWAGNGGNGNGAPPSPDYTLNIIGVEKGKKAKLTDSNRRTIFVPLVSAKSGQYSKPNFYDWDTTVQTEIVDSKIWLVPGDTFKVCDGNGFDEAYGCPDTYFDENWTTTVYDSDGNPIPVVDARKMGAVFQLPCNTNLNGLYWDSNGDGVVGDAGDLALDHLVSCNQAVDVDGNVVDVPEDYNFVPTASYQVWARALGKPGGQAISTTCATVHDELQCSLENVVLTRSSGKSTFVEVTDQVTSLVIGYCQDDVVQDSSGNWLCVADGSLDEASWTAGDVEYTRIALFAGYTKDWFWNYDNNGLRLAQLWFYDLDN